MKKLVMIIGFLLLSMPVVFAQVSSEKENLPPIPQISDVGNKLCPVSGVAVSGNDYVVYQGKRIGLCCPGCRAKFLVDPEGYLSKMESPRGIMPDSDSQK